MEKFNIYDASLKDFEYFDYLKDRYCKNIPEAKRDDFLNGILGYLVSPKTRGCTGWEITFDDFSKCIESLTTQYCSDTKIFPKKYIYEKPQANDVQDGLKHLFVRKIEEIDYGHIKHIAISEYINTNKTIAHELRDHMVSETHYNNYERELLNFYTPKYRSCSRRSNKNTLLDDSKDFYDEITGSPAQPFISFSDTPISFRNGIIHNMADDEDQSVKWKLEEKEDE
jgi:hypothetical protein